MADKLTQIDPMTRGQVLDYIDRLLAFAIRMEKVDPASADLNRWVANNYAKNINSFSP